MIDEEASFDRNQGSLRNNERRLPWLNEIVVVIPERLLNELGPVELEARTVVVHPLRRIGRL